MTISLKITHLSLFILFSFIIYLYIKKQRATVNNFARWFVLLCACGLLLSGYSWSTLVKVSLSETDIYRPFHPIILKFLSASAELNYSSKWTIRKGKWATDVEFIMVSLTRSSFSVESMYFIVCSLISTWERKIDTLWDIPRRIACQM